MKNIKYNDNEIYNLIRDESIRQQKHVELIASENYTSLSVMEAQGSQLTNKYAEGYPNNRYYGGCEFIDKIEKITIERVKKIFNSECANVQPHSGSQANQSVLFAVLKPGDTIMGLSLKSGGHLTHGMSLNMSGKWFNVITYELNNKEEIDYNQVKYLAYKYKPKLIITGGSSYSLHINFKFFSILCKKIKSFLLVDMAHYAGLIAAGLYPNPTLYSDFVTSTTHKSLRGPRGGFILMKKKYEKIINTSVFPGIQGGPLMHIIAGKAICFKEALKYEFILYQKQVLNNANNLCNILKKRKFKIVSNKTQSHLILLDLRNKKINGKLAEKILSQINIICNKNMIPNDPQKPFLTSGIRLGTSAITSRGIKEKQIKIIGNIISDTLNFYNDKFLILINKILIKNILKNYKLY